MRVSGMAFARVFLGYSRMWNTNTERARVLTAVSMRLSGGVGVRARAIGRQTFAFPFVRCVVHRFVVVELRLFEDLNL